jgi:RNA polymerase sigma factor (sigma-70 family)
MQFLKRVVEDPRLKDLPDLDLLQRFVTQHDEAAFAVLIRRYGRTAFSVCRCMLPCEADAEDAFQATSLVLARKAESICKGQSLGSWLHGVAYKTALKARANAARRRSHEAQAPSRSTSSPGEDLSWREVQAVLHEELNRLPEEYRAALVLCFLECRTLDEAARQQRFVSPRALYPCRNIPFRKPPLQFSSSPRQLPKGDPVNQQGHARNRRQDSPKSRVPQPLAQLGPEIQSGQLHFGKPAHEYRSKNACHGHENAERG